MPDACCKIVVSFLFECPEDDIGIFFVASIYAAKYGFELLPGLLETFIMSTWSDQPCFAISDANRRKSLASFFICGTLGGGHIRVHGGGFWGQLNLEGCRGRD